MMVVLFIILLGVFAIINFFVGSYLFFKDDIFGYSPSKSVRIFPFVLGAFLFFLCLLLVVYKIFLSGTPHIQPSISSSGLITDYSETKDSFLEQNEEIDMFIRMIFSSHYVDGVYQGNNYRAKGEPYLSFFNRENMKLRELDPDNGMEVIGGSFTDDRFVFIWKLYMRYMATRFDLSKVIKKLNIYI